MSKRSCGGKASSPEAVAVDFLFLALVPQGGECGLTLIGGETKEGVGKSLGDVLSAREGMQIRRRGVNQKGI